MNETVVYDAIADIIKSADDAREEYQKDKENEVLFGRVLAYSEVLSALKANMLGSSEKVDKLLDFDVDKRYTCS